MDMKKKAALMAADFLENEGEYRMGYIEAEQSNPKTRDLDKILKSDAKAGVRTLFSVDADLVPLYSKALDSAEFERLCDSVYNTLNNGNRIILSGCGSSGRLCMGVERAFRNACKKAGRSELGEQVTTIMTGGDYAVIRAVEFFEDYETLSARQVDELEAGPGDLLIGVTATAETTSILATAYRASVRGASVCMVVCSDPGKLLGKMERADRLYTRDNVFSVYLPCGAMAVTGSTRMQSSTIEQTVIATAFEAALCRLTGKSFDKEAFRKAFADTVGYLLSDDCVDQVAAYAQEEAALYRRQGYVTYYTDGYMLDILTDSTERGPTFATPPLRQQCRKDLTLSWAFAKNAKLSTKDAWENCFGRAPRCIEWDENTYRSLGVTENIPDISYDRLLEFEIGCEPDTEREETADNIAIWVDSVRPDENFYRCAAPYGKVIELVFAVDHTPTLLDIFEHIGMKMILNAISTSTAALFGRISGNYMTYLDMSNKKLIDRGSRIISELCGVTYEVALEELFLAYLQVKQSGETKSPAQEAIRKLQAAATHTQKEILHMNYKMTRFTPDIWEEALEVLSSAFAKNGVKKDFAEMYPRVFSKDARQLSDHFAAYPADKDVHGNICGCISNCEMTYHVGKEVLKISSSGNVAVKASARGTGLMTVMFEAVDQSLREDGFDLSYLHGARTRYNYFGYELCGVEYLFTFDMADLSKHYSNQNKFQFVDLSEREDLLEEAVSIINSQKVHVERRADELIRVYKARWRQPTGVFRNGQFWGSFAYGENGIKYLALKGYEDFAEMVYEFMLAKGLTTIPYDAPDYDKVLMKNCMKNCSSFAIGNPANFKIIHFERVVKAFLQLKADNEPLCDGEITLDSDLFGKYRIAVSNGTATVEKFEGEAKYHLQGYEIYDFLFNFTPNSYGEYDPAVKSWFPLPINAPYLA